MESQAESRTQKVRRSEIVIAQRIALCLLLSAFCFPILAKNGAFRSTAHGDATKGPQRRAERQRGSCTQCHDEHGSHERGPVRPDNSGLFAPNDNDLCFTCHDAPSANSIFRGTGEWARSTHAISPRMLRAGRSGSDTNKCVNCHDPHGVKDGGGLVPSMLTQREPALCLSCHDGSRGRDIQTQLNRGYVHGERARGSHSANEGIDEAKAIVTASARHVACSDCHNIHAATEARFAVDPPAASPLLSGVSRVEIRNGNAGTAPGFTFRRADDVTEVQEFEVCFKCHSSWTKQPPGQPDLARETNPANASFHPIQAAGRNRNIDPRAFSNGMTSDSLVRCTDCHGSDESRARGLHGSAYQYLLKKPSIANAGRQTMTRNDLCFDCHTFDVYAEASSPADVQRASRFNSPAAVGHAFHVGVQHVPCYSCHETHGSSRIPALIATGRMPGISSYSQNPNGGTCSPACHAPRSYTVNYSR